MPNTREKLIELLRECFDNGCYGFDEIADHLIAKGVTVKHAPRFFISDSHKKDIDDLNLNTPILVQPDTMTITPIDNRWIPVKDRLPTEKDANEEGVVLVRNIGCPMYDAMDWDQVEMFRSSISHWMSLPEPLKEGE